MVEGTAVAYCFVQAMVDCRAANEQEGLLVNTVDLQCFLDSNPGADGALELGENTAEAWIEAWESTVETHENFFLATQCLNAKALAATGAAALAVLATL